MSPLPALGDVYSASIRWTSELDKSIYDVRDDYDKRRGQAALTVKMPRLPAAAKMIYDLKLGYVSIIKDGKMQTLFSFCFLLFGRLPFFFLHSKRKCRPRYRNAIFNRWKMYFIDTTTILNIFLNDL